MNKLLVALAILFSVIAMYFSYKNNVQIAYGDAESHLNIAKRVIDSITPGFAQLGGIWLPLPHVMLIPFVFSDSLWRLGIAGSIVSGVCYVVSCLVIYKIVKFLTNSILASLAAFLAFSLNPNILYLQTTPMTELPLIMFFLLSTYFLIRYLYLENNRNNVLNLVFAAFFGFCATLSRYDGWFLVIIEAAIIGTSVLLGKDRRSVLGKVVTFSTLAFFGIFIWLVWDSLILGDPLYFTNSQYSAKSQQNGWLARGELPAYHNLPLSFAYYSVTAYKNIGIVLTTVGILGLILFLLQRPSFKRLFILLLMWVPFIFYVTTLYLGQSVIFIPDLTPSHFQYNLFNVRYGVMMVPAAAFGFGFLIYKISKYKKLGILFIALFVASHLTMFITGREKILTLVDGTSGLSRTVTHDAENWLRKNYDGGFVVIDDYARTISVIRTNIPMQNIIYVGNKPYWEESLNEPEKYAKWIITQKDDEVWTQLLYNPQKEGRLYKYFEKAYTSDEVLIFKRNQLASSIE